MSKETAHRRKDLIAEEASEWFLRLEGTDVRANAEFAAWLKASPEHVEEFLAIATLWNSLPDVLSQPYAEELIALAHRDDNVVALATPESFAPEAPAATRKTLPRWGIGIAAAAAAAALSIGLVLTLLPQPSDPNMHATAIGEQSSIPLADGSIVTLNTQSEMRVEYSPEFRDIRLLQGEALFDVAKDNRRPFRVITQHAVVTAVGTQFNVRSDSEDVTVTVVEGEVDVVATSVLSQSGGVARIPNESVSEPPLVDTAPTDSQPTRLTVGQQAKVASRSGEVAVVETAVEKATAWRERSLVFEAMSLAEVIDEFNRYNDPPLVINDDKLGVLPINGVFRSNDRASFVEFLERMQLAEARTRADGTIELRAVRKENHRE